METYAIYAGGDFVHTSEPLTIRNSYTNEVVATTFLASKNELEKAIRQAMVAREAMKQLPSFKRYEILMQIAHELKQERSRLAELLALEACKPIKYALGEIDRGIQTFIVAAEESKRLPSEYLSIDWTAAGLGKEAIVRYFPLGIIAGIVPFNFPLNLAAHKIAPAIASGNCIIIKPARSTPISTLELAKIIDKTELPKGAFSVLPMDRLAGQQLVEDPRIQMLTFTGSPEVGWKMKSQAGKKKITLELGGNAGVIVTPTAPIDLALQKCLTGAFSYSGQICIHTQRIYVERSIFDSFLEQFCTAASKLKIGHVLEPDTDISAMIDEENAIRVEAWINEAVSQGARIACGGKRHGSVVEPTVLTNTQSSMKVCGLEAFGPVVTIEPYDDFKQAVEQINNSPYGLQAGVFTNAIDEMNYAFEHVEAGGVIVNDVPTFRVDHMPYGGIKDSGFGREGVKYAIMEMMEPKIMVKPK
ncbi:MAG TPA: aldehyde dehydrogenase family protein [Bacteroidales bacterium]|jgi:glyceraldehyde-3-phosphate dehydrogenase (NADP+)|nr:aldehyde dehydrogenase family protein [Bacteroidales bacterium]